MKSIKKWSFTQVMVIWLSGADTCRCMHFNAADMQCQWKVAQFSRCTVYIMYLCLCDRTSNCCPGISVYISGKVGHAVFNSSRRLGRYCLCDVCACSYESQTHHSGTRDAAKLF